jgi:protein SCO1/2
MFLSGDQTVDPEMRFARMVDALASGPAAEHNLLDLLREDRSEYSERNSSAVARMRGWILLALSRRQISDAALPFVLEELQSGTDPYLIATASRALRTYPLPNPFLTPVVLHALRNAPAEPISFSGYGQYALEDSETTPVSELLAVLEWLGANAVSALPELVSMKRGNAISRRLRPQLKQTIEAIRTAESVSEDSQQNCCVFGTGLGWRAWDRRGRALPAPVESVPFQDQDGQEVSYGEFFRDVPCVVVFFYTRCDNPWKCSLTITKLARLQRALRERGLSEQVKTAAITYDPDSDLPQRLRAYGQERGINFTKNDRMLRARQDFESLLSHFELGVGFVGPLVNRHQIELYLVDHEGRIAAKFSRLQWDEADVANRVSEMIEENRGRAARPRPKFAFLTVLLSLAWALCPKCAMCWASYASAFGILGLTNLRFPSHLAYILATLFLLNLAVLLARARASKRTAVFWLACLGATLIALGRSIPAGSKIVQAGAILTVLASLWSVFLPRGNSTLSKKHYDPVSGTTRRRMNYWSRRTMSKPSHSFEGRVNV